MAAVAPEETIHSSPVATWEAFIPPFLTLQPRIDMAAVIDNARGSLLGFSGQDSSGFKVDLQSFSFATQEWSEVKPTVTLAVDSVDTPGSAEGVAVKGDSVYVADGLAGIAVAHFGRISNPLDPTFDVVDRLEASGYVRQVAVHGDYLYAAETSGGVEVWNTQNLAAGVVARYPSLHAADGIFPVGWGLPPVVPHDSAFVFVADDEAYSILMHQAADSVPPSLAVAPVEKAGLPGLFSVYAVASECLADTLFTVDGLRYRFTYAWQDGGTHRDSTSLRTLDMDLLDEGERLYGSTATLNIGPVLDSLAAAVPGLVEDSLRLSLQWSAVDISSAANVGSGHEEIAVGTVLGEIGASLHAVNPAIRLDIPAGSFAGRASFFLLGASSSWRTVQGGRSHLDPLSGTPDPSAAGLRSAGDWCRASWTARSLEKAFLLHLPLDAGAGSGVGEGAGDVAVYRMIDGGWERVGGDIQGSEIIAPVDRPGLYRVFMGGASTPSLASRSMLDQNVPNPFNPKTVINYRVPAAGNVTLAIYDTAGRLVRTLEQGFRPAGEASVMWLGEDDAGKQVASGVYFYRLDTASRSESRKMVLLR